MSKKKNKKIGEIFISGDIDAETVKKTVDELVKFENDGCQIEIYINTSGGDPYSALALHDYIRGIRSFVTTIALGHIDSAGVIIFLSGDERQITKNSSLMLHRARILYSQAMYRDTLDQLANDIKFIEEKKVELLAKYTKMSKKRIRAFVASGKRFNAKQAVKCGLAKKII